LKKQQLSLVDTIIDCITTATNIASMLTDRCLPRYCNDAANLASGGVAFFVFFAKGGIIRCIIRF
jgi:hypothetical protein